MSQTPPPLTLQSRVQFHELTVRRERGRDPLLGCPAIRRFMEVDEDTLYAIEVIKRTPTLGEAEATILRERNEEWDLIDLVSTLGNRGFVREFDGFTIRVEQEARTRHPILHSISPERLAWLRSPLLLAAIGTLVLAWFAAMIIDSSVAPKFAHLYPFGRLSLTIIATFGAFLATAYVHELAHFFVARSYGIDATINLSHRYSMIVLQTDVTNAWGLPAPARIAIFLAGIAFNLTVASVCGVLVFLSHMDVVQMTYATERTLHFIKAVNTIPLLFQLLITARTDLYHVILVFTKERNLSSEATSYLFFRLRRGFASLRGAPRARCTACAGAILEADPFCPACGELRSAKDAPTWAKRSDGRSRLIAWGALFVLGMFYGLYAILFMGLKFLIANTSGAIRVTGVAFARGEALLIAEGILALLVCGLQFAFVAVFASSAIKPWIPASIRSVPARMRAAMLGAMRPEPTRRSATLELLAVNGRSIAQPTIPAPRRASLELLAIDGRVVPRRIAADRPSDSTTR